METVDACSKEHKEGTPPVAREVDLKVVVFAEQEPLPYPRPGRQNEQFRSIDKNQSMLSTDCRGRAIRQFNRRGIDTKHGAEDCHRPRGAAVNSSVTLRPYPAPFA